MTFSPFKVGGYAYGEILTSAQVNQANDDIQFALDGRDGGDYTPSDDLDIQTPTAKTVILNSCTFTSAADGGGLNLGGENLTNVDQIACSGVSCAGPVASASASTGTLTASSNVALGTNSANSLTINAKTTANQRVRSPKGMIKGGYSGSTYQYAMANYDVIYIPEGQAVAASTVWQISTANTHIDGVQSGEIMSFRNLGTGQPIVIKDPAGTTIVTALGPLGGSNLIRVDIAYDPTEVAYVIIDRGYN